MRNLLVSLSAFAFATACAGGSSGPTFEYGPSSTPLRYQVSSKTESVIETPMGAQNANDTSNVTVTLQIGEPAGDGRQVIAVFEEFNSQITGVGKIDGGEMLGQEFSGILAHDGTIEFTETPSSPKKLSDYIDPAAFLSELLVPMPPPGSEAVETWPVSQEYTEYTQVTMTNTVEGTARIVGDTVWNGQPAKLIEIRADYSLEGIGTPTGSPGELEMVLSGPGTTRAVWDAQRGVLLSATSHGSATGTVTIAGMDITLPVTAESWTSIVLGNQGG